jgi:hypothetical protein
VAAGFALRVDALNGEAGQELHSFSLRGREAQTDLKRDRRLAAIKKF